MPKLINWDLLGHPLNWAIVFIMATVWLLAFHVVMTGYASMTGDDSIGGGPPGSVASPVPATSDFMAQNVLGAGAVPMPLQSFPQGNNYSDTMDRSYAEDNFGINY